MTVLHTGATKKFVAGWEQVFGGRADKPATAKKKSPSAKKPQKKSKSRGKR